LLLKGGSEADPGKDANKQKNKTALVQVCKNLSLIMMMIAWMWNLLLVNLYFCFVELHVEKGTGQYVDIRC